MASGGAQPVEGNNSKVDVKLHPVYHIVEEPGMMAHMADCEVPTEEYYDALSKDIRSRHPNASEWVPLRDP